MMEGIWVLFLASGGFLVLISLISFLAFLFYNQEESLDKSIQQGVSVIICAKNELENLRQNLPKFLNQDYRDFEVIVVDDRSTDGSYEYLYELADGHPVLNLVRIDDTPDHINNKKYALTLGIRAAKHELILLSDADCWPNSNRWISEMTAPFSKEHIDLVIGYSQYSGQGGFLINFIKYETLLTGLNYLSLALLGKPYMGVGRNLAYRKSLFIDARGFGRYQKVVGGDDDLFVKEHAQRRNTAVQIGRSALVYSQPKQSLNSYLIQKKRHMSVGRHYKMSDKVILGAIFLAKLVFWTTFISVILAGFKLNQALIGFLIISFTYLATILLLKFKAGDRTSLWLSPFLEFIYLFYYISVGLGVLFTKRIKWS
jgi:glycosyltransferase involved in cell wall biosynthesis